MWVFITTVCTWIGFLVLYVLLVLALAWLFGRLRHEEPEDAFTQMRDAARWN